MIARRVLCVIAALLLGLVIVRNAAVGLLAQRAPGSAARVWRDHPDVEISSAMTKIALAARAGRAAPSAVFPILSKAAVQDPLAADPYLVRGVQLSLSGDAGGAERAFKAAQWRDPRSLPAAYFLANLYVREGQTAPALRQIAALARLSPNGGQTAGPYIASFAADPSNWPALRVAFRENPGLAEPTFDVLSSNIATVPSLLALVDPRTVSAKASWFPRLLDTLINSGQYAKAKSLWVRATRSRAGELIHDAQFADTTSLAQFNWALTSNGVGLAERQAGGRLHVLYYGQEDGILATQLLTLRPGRYRLKYRLLGGQSAGENRITWSIWCDKALAALSSVTLRQGAEGGLQFAIPADCPAQWLRLSGSSGDIAQQADIMIGELRLEALPGA
jgi:hypothetical protein